MNCRISQFCVIYLPNPLQIQGSIEFNGNICVCVCVWRVWVVKKKNNVSYSIDKRSKLVKFGVRILLYYYCGHKLKFLSGLLNTEKKKN